MKILLIDDEPDILELMAEEFMYLGHKVSKTSSGKEAIEILKNETFDAVVSDFKMPNGNGMSVLEFTKTILPRPVFFFVSGQADVSIKECIKAGAVAFFSKPFDLDCLVDEVEKELS